MITTKRAYEPASPKDGTRILVDRLWPRGVSKAKLKLDYWAKDVAPSTELRTWYAHDPKKWPEFKKRYKAELRKNKEAFAAFAKIAKKKKTTLLYGAKDERFNEATVLAELLNL